MMLCVDTGNIEMIRVMIETGVPINSVDACGETVLHRSTSKGFTMMTSYLLSAKADPTIKNYFGRTALEMAAKEPWDTPGKAHSKQEVASLIRCETARHIPIMT